MKAREKEVGAAMILLAYPDPGEEKMTTARHIPPPRSQTSLAFGAEIKTVQQPDCPER